jgi:hypothetical protein
LSTKITRRLHALKFFHEGTEFVFDGIKVSVDPKLVIPKYFDPNKTTLYDIEFEKIEKDFGNNIVVITSVTETIEDRLYPALFNDTEDQRFNRKVYNYGFISYFAIFAMGTFSLVPPIHADGMIESKKLLNLELGKHYIIKLIQKETED